MDYMLLRGLLFYKNFAMRVLKSDRTDPLIIPFVDYINDLPLFTALFDLCRLRELDLVADSTNLKRLCMKLSLYNYLQVYLSIRFIGVETCFVVFDTG
jgi:hypothetical protein